MNFDNTHPRSTRLQLSQPFFYLLEDLEKMVGQELTITSAFRSVHHEIKSGRDGSSSHCLGKAVDIYCYDSRLRYKIVTSALKLGVNRIGIYKNFIHLDVATERDSKATDVIWYG